MIILMRMNEKLFFTSRSCNSEKYFLIINELAQESHLMF